MRFRSFDSLRVFDVVARHLSFTAAAEELSLSKGAVSYQIGRLEEELGFPVFVRQHRGIALTERGVRLWQAAQPSFRTLEREIANLRGFAGDARITVGLSTYFASRWLSSRLMTFIGAHPGVALRLQPAIDLIDLSEQGIDMAIRWGKGRWQDCRVEPLLSCPAFPTAGTVIYARSTAVGLPDLLPELPLLHDRDGSQAWQDWHRAADLPYRPTRDDLVIPDPNVRVQAVIDGQGLALNDALVADELADKRLFRLSDVALDDYGYFLAYADGALDNPALRAFRDWLVEEAQSAMPAVSYERVAGER